MAMTLEEWNRDINNYVQINNEFFITYFGKQHELNPEAVQKTKLKGKLRFTDEQLQTVPELEGYISEPLHGSDYRSIIDNKWNTYHYVEHTPREGQWPTIEKLINHLYGDNGVEEDQREELYDYHTVLLKWPKQRQQARVLYSHHQGTAKSALGNLEKLMFGNNVGKVRDAEMEAEHNSTWVEKLIIWMDEPYFDKPKRAARDIRDLVTAETQNLRKMYADRVEVPFYGKVLITTNDTDFMPIEKSDRRYWIREVPRIKEADIDPTFMDKIETEIDHYIHFLLTREMKYKKNEDKTFYLPDTILKTRGFTKLVGDNVSSNHVDLADFFQDYFGRDKKRDHVCFILKDLISMVPWSGKEPSKNEVKQLLRDGLGIVQPTKPRRLKKGEYYIDNGSESCLIPNAFWRVERYEVYEEPEADDVFDTKSIKI